MTIDITVHSLAAMQWMPKSVATCFTSKWKQWKKCASSGNAEQQCKVCT